MAFSKDRARALVDVLQPERLTRIIDIGAHPVHTPPYRGLFDSGLCEVWGFEPQSDAYDKLMAQKGAREHYQPHVIGDGNETPLHICRSEGFTSTLEPNLRTLEFLGRWQNAMTVEATHQMQSKRLDDLTEIPAADLIKIDVQGGELTIFQNAKRQLDHVTSIITEVAFVPLYKDQPLYHKQAEELEKSKFFLHKFMSLERKCISSPLMQPLDWRRHQSQNIDGDAVFIKDLAYPDNCSDEQLKHLAICADAVFGSFDLALKCLSFLIAREVIREPDVSSYIGLIPHQRG